MSNKGTIVQLEDIEIDLFEYIDENSDYLKKEYLNIVLNIGNLKIKNQKFKHLLEYNGHSLWEMSLINEKNIYKNNYVFKTIKYLALKKILNENLNKKTTINFLEGDLANILRKQFRSSKVVFQKSDLSLVDKIKCIIRKSSAYNYILFFYFFVKNCNFTKKSKINFQKKKIILFSYFTHYDTGKFFDGIFNPKQWSHLWGIIKPNSNFVQLFIPSKNFSFFFQVKNFLLKRKIKDLDEKNFINNFIFFQYYKKVRVDFKKFKKKIGFFQIDEVFKINREFEFFYLINKELFISSFSGHILLQNLLWIRVFDDLMSEMPKHSWGIFLYENQPWEKALITSWRKFNHGYLIGYSHTTINYWHLNYFNDPNYNLSEEFEKFNPDFIAVSSEISKNFLLSQSINPKKILEVEALRYLWIADKKKQYNKKKKRKILFLGDYKGTINQKLIVILNQLKSNLFNSGFEITFKPHPATSVKNLDKDIIQTSEDLEYLVNKFEYVVSSNTTSAIIEVLSCGLKTFLFKDKNNFDLSPLKNTILDNKTNSFYTKEDLLNKIKINKNNFDSIDYYYLNKDLIRWKKILEIKK